MKVREKKVERKSGSDRKRREGTAKKLGGDKLNFTEVSHDSNFRAGLASTSTT